MMKLRLAPISAAIALLFLGWGCSAPNSNPPLPGQKQIDKARDAKDTIEKRGEEQKKQENEQEQQ